MVLYPLGRQRLFGSFLSLLLSHFSWPRFPIGRSSVRGASGPLFEPLLRSNFRTIFLVPFPNGIPPNNFNEPEDSMRKISRLDTVLLPSLLAGDITGMAVRPEDIEELLKVHNRVEIEEFTHCEETDENND